MGCFGSAPQAPDPYQTAMAQVGVNSAAIKDTTKYNQINQNNPFGSLSYTGSYDDPNNPRTQNVTLSPELQKILTGQTGVTQGLTDLSLSRLGQIPKNGYTPDADPNAYGDASWNTPLERGNSSWVQPMWTGDSSWNTPLQRSASAKNDVTYGFDDVGGPQRSLGNMDFAQQIKDAGDAVYGTQTQYVDQDFAKQDRSLEANLAAKGIPEGSEAWNQAKGELQQQRQQTLQGARNAATTQGFNVQQGLFGEQLAGAQFGNQAQGQAYDQALGRSGFYNSAQAQDFGQSLDNAQLNNNALGQNFQQGMQIVDQANKANNDTFNQRMSLAGLNNSALSQNFNQGMQVAGYNQGEYQRRQGNNIQNRTQNFNELAAFLNGSPISPSNPTFQPTTQYQPSQASPNLVGTANNNYSSTRAARAGILGSIFGSLGSLGGAAIGKWG